MKIFVRNAAALGLSLLVCASIVNADDLRELKERIVAAKEEAAELRDLGKIEEAEATEREAEELTMHAKRVYEEQQSRRVKAKPNKEHATDHPEINHLRMRLRELQIAMKKAEARNASEDERHQLGEKIVRTEQELAEIAKHVALEHHDAIPPQLRERAEHIDMMARRIHHVRVAAENLKEAEMHDLAHELMERAEGMQREVHEAKEELAREMESMREHHEPRERGDIQELREENEHLRRELNELREAVEKLRADRD